ASDATLHIAKSGRGPHHRKILFESVLHVRRTIRIGCGRGCWSGTGSPAAGRGRTWGKRAIVDRKLEVHRTAFAACIDEPRLPIVIRRQSPLAAVRCRRLAKKTRRSPANAEGVVGRVDPVVHVPEQAGFLMLDVRVAALA